MRRISNPLVLFVSMAALLSYAPTVRAQGTIVTVAGGAPNNVPALQAPIGAVSVFVDAAGNQYVAGSAAVYKIDTSGQLTTVAGNGTEGFSGDGGPATSAQLGGSPCGLFVDSSGNIFVADPANNRIREVAAATGIIQTVAGGATAGFSGDGGPATNAQLNFPLAVTLDSSGNIFIADTFNERIREVVAATGIIQTVAGSGTAGFGGDGGPAINALLWGPSGVAVDGSGNIFIADQQNQRIREVTGATGAIQTVAGNGVYGFSGDGGPAVSASLRLPGSLSLDGQGDVFIADTDNNRVREISAGTGIISTVAGNGFTNPNTGQGGYSGDGGPATSAELSVPGGVFVDTTGNLFIADTDNERVREVAAATGNIQTVAGNGTFSFGGDGGLATSAQLSAPEGIFVDISGNIFVTDSHNNRIREVMASNGNIQTVAGNGAVDSNPNDPFPGDGGAFSGDGGPAVDAALRRPLAVYGDSAGNIFIGDSDNFRVREISAATGNINTIAGNGQGFCGNTAPPCLPLGDGGPPTKASLTPTGLYVDGGGNMLIVDNGDRSNFTRLREVNSATGNIGTVALIGNISTSHLQGLAVDGAGNAYTGWNGPGNEIVQVNLATGTVTTFLASNTAGGLGFPEGEFADSAGNVFVADTEKNRVLEVVAATGAIQTVAGTGTAGFGGDGGPATIAELDQPTAVWEDSLGNLFIADNGNNRIREVVFQKKDQTIAFAGIANRVFVPGDTFTASATASSDLGATFTVGATDSCTLSGTTVQITGVGSCTVTAHQAGNDFYNAASDVAQSFRILYAPAGQTCDAAPGHAILPPINADGSTVRNQGSTIPAQFRVCDGNGNSVGTPGVVASFSLVGTSSGTGGGDPASSTPDPLFRWDATNQQWIYNIDTSALTAGNTYMYQVLLNDGTTIAFHFGLK